MKPKILVTNVYFAPYSYGGATLLAEEIAVLLQEMGWEVLVFTTHRDNIPLIRYRDKGLNVISALVDGDDPDENHTNPCMYHLFDRTVKSFKPDICHIHCIQEIGAEVLNSLTENSIPYVITLHDAWWICAKQFMNDGSGHHCFQERIEHEVCAKRCFLSLEHLEFRRRFLDRYIKNAELLLSPSQFFADFYKQNYTPELAVKVNKNGVKPPASSFEKEPSGSIRFAFVGGEGRNKGWPLIKKAFSELKLTDVILKVIDISEAERLSLKKNIKVIDTPRYNYETLDAFFVGIDVLLFPSQWKESFGLIVREALLRDVWVISTNGGGTVEDIVDGENGTVIPLDGDHENLLSAIKECLQMNFENYSNPYKDKIRTIKEQTTELDYLLTTIIDQKPQ